MRSFGLPQDLGLLNSSDLAQVVQMPSKVGLSREYRDSLRSSGRLLGQRKSQAAGTRSILPDQSANVDES